jgi:DNA-binding CsgD family transcriptional regulator
MWLMSKLRTDPTDSLATLRERCARWLTTQGRAQDAARQILQGRLRTLGDFAVLESRGLSLIWGFGPEALAAYLPLPLPHMKYPRLTRAHSLACRLEGRGPEVAPASDVGSAVDDIPDDDDEQLITNAWQCVLADIAVGDSAMTGIQNLTAKLEGHPADDLADISGVLLAICAFNRNDTSSAALRGLAAHDRLVARSRPYGAYIAQLYCGFAAAQAGLLMQAVAHFRACATLAAAGSLGEESLRRSQTCVLRILCWLGAPPHVADPTGMEQHAGRIGVDPLPPAFEARIEIAYRASLARGTSAQARAILEEGAAQARARGWRRVAAGLECSLIDHVARFGAPEGITARLECLVSEVAALHSPHLEQRMALAGVRIRIMQGDLEQARRQLDGVFSTAETERTTLAVCTAFLRFGMLLARGDSRLSEQAGVHLLNLAEHCPCVGLLAQDVELLSRHVETDIARRRLTAMIAQLNNYSRATLQGATSHADLPDTQPCALSPRERDVLDLLASGMSRRETSEFLCVSESSVKSYQASLFRKLGVTRRSDVIQEAKRRGFWHSQRLTS